jgi:hypothetical protein
MPRVFARRPVCHLRQYENLGTGRNRAWAQFYLLSSYFYLSALFPRGPTVANGVIIRVAALD